MMLDVPPADGAMVTVLHPSGHHHVCNEQQRAIRTAEQLTATFAFFSPPPPEPDPIVGDDLSLKFRAVAAVHALAKWCGGPVWRRWLAYRTAKSEREREGLRRQGWPV